MEFHEEHGKTHTISAYTANSITVNGTTYYTSLLVGLDSVTPIPIQTLADLSPALLTHYKGARIECVLIGAERAKKEHPLQLIAAFQQQGVGCEIMTLEAACRTFNIMSADQRKVVAILLLESTSA